MFGGYGVHVLASGPGQARPFGEIYRNYLLATGKALPTCFAPGRVG